MFRLGFFQTIMHFNYTFILGISSALTNSSSPIHTPKLTPNSNTLPFGPSRDIITTAATTSNGTEGEPGSISTTIVTQKTYTTYCPSPITLVWGSQTTTVTKPSTITITDCPCKLTHIERTGTSLSPSDYDSATTDVTDSSSELSRVNPQATASSNPNGSGNETVSASSSSLNSTNGDSHSKVSASNTEGGLNAGGTGETVLGKSSNELQATIDVVRSYTSYFPFATTFIQGSSTYTITGPTTLTITDCPCTITSSPEMSVNRNATESLSHKSGGASPIVVSSLTTFVASPTTLIFKSQTYAVSGATTLTITDCPCTLFPSGNSTLSFGTGSGSGDVTGSNPQSANWAGKLEFPISIVLAAAGILAL